MKRTRVLAWSGVASLVVLLAVVVVCLEIATMRTRAATETTKVQRANLAIDQANRNAETKAAPRNQPSTAAELPTTAAVSPASSGTSDQNRLLDRDDRRRAILQPWLAHTYELFFRSTALSREQKAAFEQAVVAHWLRWADVVDAGRGQGLGLTDQKIWTDLSKQEWTQFQSEERAALGPELFARLLQFERRVPMKEIADVVAGAVFDSPEPLGPDRAELLINVLANASEPFRKGGQASLDDLDKAAVITALQPVLSPRQLSALETTLATRDSIEKLMRLLEAARRDAAH